MNNFDNPLNMLQNIGMFSFCVYLLDTIFLVKNEMGVTGTKKNVFIAGTTSTIVMTIPYILVAMVAYYSFGTLAMNIDLWPSRPHLINSFGDDILMKMAVGLLICSVTLSNIARIVALKVQVFMMMNKKLTWKTNVIWTVGVMYIPCLVAYVYPSVNDWVSLMGAFCMTSLANLLPAMLSYKIYKEEGKNFKAAMIVVWATIFCFIGYSSTILTLLKMTQLMKFD